MEKLEPKSLLTLSSDKYIKLYSDNIIEKLVNSGIKILSDKKLIIC